MKTIFIITDMLLLFFRWFCHFDDDNYVNLPNLVSFLERYDAGEPHYLGKSSRRRTKLKNVMSSNGKTTDKPFVAFSFGTGGAGFCLSKAAMKKLKRHISRLSGGSGLEGVCRRLAGLSDDVAVGYVNGKTVKLNRLSSTMNINFKLI